jgi:Spy/CpxP family protein refolding chaperone
MRSLGGKYQDDRQARREAMQSVMKETDEKIEALLTKEQKTKYEDLVKQRRSRFSGRGS